MEQLTHRFSSMEAGVGHFGQIGQGERLECMGRRGWGFGIFARIVSPFQGLRRLEACVTLMADVSDNSDGAVEF